MLGHRSSANLLATSLSHCVRTTLLSFSCLTSEWKINCTHISYHCVTGVTKPKYRNSRLFRIFGFCCESVCELRCIRWPNFGNSFSYTCYTDKITCRYPHTRYPSVGHKRFFNISLQSDCSVRHRAVFSYYVVLSVNLHNGKFVSDGRKTM